MAITAKLLRAGVGFDNQGMTIGVYCQLQDDVLGDLGVRYYALEDATTHEQVLQILTQSLPLLGSVIGVTAVLPNTTTVAVRGISPVTMPPPEPFAAIPVIIPAPPETSNTSPDVMT